MNLHPTKTRFIFSAQNYVTALLFIIVAGIVLLNRTFTHIALHNIYVTEFVLINMLLVIAASPEFYRRFLSKEYLLPGAFILCGLLQLFLNSNHSFNALRHSLIVFYGVFLVVFLFVFDSEKKIRTFLLCSFLLNVFVNCPKIIYYWLTDKIYSYETYRTLHSEVDVICAGLSIIALLIFHTYFVNKSRLVYALLLAANSIVLLLTVKRSALVGLVLVLLLMVMIKRDKVFYRRLITIFVYFFVIIAIALAGLYLYSSQEFGNVIEFALGKLKYTEEAGSAWRLTVWKQGWEKFLSSPLFGIGFGRPILEQSVRFTTTQDTHNSLLALLIRTGTLGAIIFFLMLIQTFLLYLKKYTATSSENDKSLILFFLLGFVFMINYAFFNVVLENQYNGIFFWFMLSGVYMLNNIKTTGQPSLTFTGRSALFACGLSAILIITYVALLFSPLNYVRSIMIYDAKIGAQIPVVQQKNDIEITVIKNTSNGLMVNSIGKDEGWSTLLWVIPEQIQNLKKEAERYAFVLKLADPIGYHPTFAVNDLLGNQYAADNPVIEESRIVIPLGDFVGVDWDKARVFSMSLPHGQHNVQFTVERLEIARTEIFADDVR